MSETIPYEHCEKPVFEELGFIAIHESGEVDELSFTSASDELRKLVIGWRWVSVKRIYCPIPSGGDGHSFHTVS